MLSRTIGGIIAFTLIVAALVANISFGGVGSLRESAIMFAVSIVSFHAIFGIIAAVLIGVVGGIGYLLTAGDRKNDRELREKLRKADRLLSWDALNYDIEAGKGTLIVEICDSRLSFWRIWWTTEKLLDRAPVPPPTDGDLIDDIEERPFVAWCIRRYIDADSGTALLTDYNGRSENYLFTVSEAIQYFQEKFPGLLVVVLPLTRKAA